MRTINVLVLISILSAIVFGGFKGYEANQQYQCKQTLMNDGWTQDAIDDINDQLKMSTCDFEKAHYTFAGFKWRR